MKKRFLEEREMWNSMANDWETMQKVDILPIKCNNHLCQNK